MNTAINAKSVRIRRAAELLLWSRTNRTRLQGLPADLMPRDLNEGYEIQSAVTSLRSVPHAGFKIGLTNEAAQRAADTSAPIAGRLGVLDVRRTNSLAELPANHLRVIEAEVVFEVGNDLPAAHGPYTEQRVAASLSRAYAGIELCNSRLEEGPEVTLPCLVADNSNADLIFVGDPLKQADITALANLPVTLERRGKPLIQGSTASVMGNPLRAVTWLANFLARRGEGLKRGQLICSGSCTGMTQVAPEDAVVVRFGDEARVCVEFAVAAEKSEVRE